MYAYGEYTAYIPYAVSPYQHDFYCAGYPRKASAIYFFVVADKLLPASFTQVILAAVAFMSVSHYTVTVAVGACEFYGDCHSFIVSLVALITFYTIILCSSPPTRLYPNNPHGHSS